MTSRAHYRVWGVLGEEAAGSGRGVSGVEGGGLNWRGSSKHITTR